MTDTLQPARAHTIRTTHRNRDVDLWIHDRTTVGLSTVQDEGLDFTRGPVFLDERGLWELADAATRLADVLTDPQPATFSWTHAARFVSAVFGEDYTGADLAAVERAIPGTLPRVLFAACAQVLCSTRERPDLHAL